MINQTGLDETRPSSLIRSVVEPNVLQSLLTTNPVLLAVDDLIREQSSLLRSFIQLQRTYYESTIRSIRPEHVYVTKDNTLQVPFVDYDFMYEDHSDMSIYRFSLLPISNNKFECIINPMMIDFFSNDVCVFYFVKRNQTVNNN